MVTIDKKRQLSEAEKQTVLEKQGHRCFIDNHPLDPESGVEFDHIDPHSGGGPSAEFNIGAVCKKHNRDKRGMSLSEFRDLLAIRRFFEGSDKRRLDDLLAKKLGANGYGKALMVEEEDGHVILYFEEGPARTPIAICPATGERYFFAMMPVEHLRNDSELQPRALEQNRVWELYRHLLRHTQLAPAVCRLVGDNQVLLFDGQHKAAAQLWAGRDRLDCKIYIEPEVRKLKETNLTAHDKLRQMPFYTSTLIEKFASLAAEDWEAFLESDRAKTEQAFVDFMRSRNNLSRAQALTRIRSQIFQDIIDHPHNRFKEYIAEENRARKNPITMSRLQKTFFKEFITDPPLDDEFEGDDHHREEERENVVRLLNLVVDEVLEGKWAPERDDDTHKRTARIFSAGSLRAWVPFLRDAIAPSLSLFDAQDRARIFYRPLTDADFDVIRRLVLRMFSHKVWVDPSPDLNDLRYDNAERAKDMLRDWGLTPNWVLGGEE